MDVLGLVLDVTRTFIGPMLLMAISTYCRPMILGSLGLAWFALLLGGVHLGAGMLHYKTQALPIAGAFTICLLATLRHWAADLRTILLTLLLIALPFAISLGTWNPIQIMILSALAPWGALMGLLSFASQQPRLLPGLISLLFCTIVFVQIVSNGSDPYRMRPISEQVELTEIGQLGTVRVDPKTAAMVRDLQRAAANCNIAIFSPFLDFYDLPGVALILDAVPVESPWLLDPQYAAQVLKRADTALLHKSIVAMKLQTDGKRPPPPLQLQEFPAGFRLCGSAIGPWDSRKIELWAPYGSAPQTPNHQRNSGGSDS